MSWADAPLRTRPITAEEALAVINGAIRRMCGGEPWPEESGVEPWTREDSLDGVSHWLEDLSDETPTPLDCANWCAASFVLPDTEAIEPWFEHAAQHTIGKLCDVLATIARVQVVEPVTVFGIDSWEAGAFRTVRGILRQAGADVQGVTLQSPLEPFLVAHREVFEREIANLAPSRMPALKFAYSTSEKVGDWIARVVAVCWIGGFGAVAVGMLFDRVSWVVAFSGACTIAIGLICWGLHWSLSKLRLIRDEPVGMQLGELRTFADLCHVIAVEHRAKPAATTITTARATESVHVLVSAGRASI